MTPDLAAAIATIAAADRLLVALDFDGTLSELVSVPSDARPAPGVLDGLRRLGDTVDTDLVLISGRARHDLAEVSGAADLALLFGSHGQEQGETVALDQAESDLLDHLRGRVEAAVVDLPCTRVEAKPAGFAVHVRGCPTEQAQAVEAAIRAVADELPAVHTIAGKSVVEVSVRPLDKGSAVRALIEADPDRRVLFAGDDVTDETALGALRAGDLGIKVGTGDTVATFRVEHPSAMVEVLAALVEARSSRGA